MSKFLYPIYKLKTKSYIKWWLYHKKAGGSGILSEILQGFSFNLENTLNRKFKLFEIEGNSVQDGTPSPDNEVPIYSAGDNENLVNESNINFIYSSVNKVIYDNGLIKTINSPNGQFYEFDEPLQSGETYTLTFKFVQGRVNVQGSQDFSLGMYHSGNNNSWQGILTKTQIANIDLAGKTFTLTHKATDTITGLYIFIYSSPTFVTPLWFNVKVEKGNKATPYSPYGMGSINEKIINKNVWNIDKFKNLYGTNTYETYNNIECLKLAGATQRYNFDGEENTQYTFQFKLIGSTFNNEIGAFSLVYSDGTSDYHDGILTPKTYTFTSKANKTLVRIVWNAWNAGNFIYIDKNSMQLEPGTTATPYVPHEEQDYSIFVQQPFRSIGDVRDKFVNVNGNWYERHYIGEIVLDGTESWQQSGQSRQRFLFYGSNNALTNSAQILAMCEKYRGIKFDDLNSDINYTCYSQEGYFGFNTKDIFSLSEWKEELSNDNLSLYYVLATPLDLPCTEVQIQQLENLPSTYKDFTIIQSQDETPAYLKIQYWKEVQS